MTFAAADSSSKRPIDVGAPGLIVAQFRAFASKMPAFYISIAASKIAECYAFYGAAPGWMCWGVCGVATLVCVARAAWWMRHRDDEVSETVAGQTLKRAATALIIAALFFIICDLAFYRYADGDTRMLLAFIELSSAMCSFFCLMHLRVAALMMAGVILSPLIGMLVYQNTASSWAIACNVLVVAIVMIIVMRSYFRDFTTLVTSRAAIEAQRIGTERLSAENLRLANLDMLTDLPNRRCFFAALEQKVESAIAQRRDLAVGILDLDGFKPINDLHGHSVGDRMLERVADRLRDVTAGHATVYRLGGDEFAVLIENPDSDAMLIDLGKQCLNIVCQPIRIGALVTTVGCSMGFARWSAVQEDAAKLYDQADFALYHAKRTGRGQVLIFTQEHERLIKAQGRVERALRDADLEQELYLLFQPIVDVLAGQTTIAFECLARWNSPALGEVSPASFIVVAEQAGIMTSLTPILLRKALSAAVTWPEPVRMSFNLSAHDIASAECTQAIIQIVMESGFDPHRIDMELTETALACNFDLAFAHMSMLKAVGISISLDDFGTGYSSISHIHALPLDKIKIDRSFVKGLGVDANSFKIVKSLSALCRDMGLACTVEGVETEQQMSAASRARMRHRAGLLLRKADGCDRHRTLSAKRKRAGTSWPDYRGLAAFLRHHMQDVRLA